MDELSNIGEYKHFTKKKIALYQQMKYYLTPFNILQMELCITLVIYHEVDKQLLKSLRA